MVALARQLQRLPESTRSILLTAIYGLVGGLAAVGFEIGINLIYANTFVRLSAYSPATFVIGSFVIVVGCSVAGAWLLTRFCREAAGSGIPQLKFAFWQDFGHVPIKTVWVKFLAGLLHVGGGMSLGREGPSIHIAGGAASQVAGALGVPKQRRRQPAAAGAAAGLAAAFNTPLAAITFVLEEIVQNLNSPLVGSIILASVIGAFMVHAIIGSHPAFVLPQIEHSTWRAYVFVPIASAFAALVGIGFGKATLWLKRTARGWTKLPALFHPLIGGLTVWALGVAVFLWSGRLGVFGLGYDDLTAVLNGQLIWQLVLALLVAKWIATTVCYGSGGCGGIFAPCLFLGATAGAVIASGAAPLLTLGLDDRTLLAVVGMSACLSAVVRAPFTSILIVFEMTHQFELVPALMLGALVSEAISRLFSQHNFYDDVLTQDGIVLVHVIPPRDLRSWQAYPVSAIANFRPVFLTSYDPAHLQATLDASQFQRFPFIENGTLIGAVTRLEVAEALGVGRPPLLETIVTCRRAQTIGEVARLLIESPLGLAVVVAEEKPVGIVTLHDLLRAQESLAGRSEQ